MRIQIEPGVDWFRRFIWQQKGEPVELNINEAKAVLTGADKAVEINADFVEWGKYKGVVDVYFNAATTSELSLGYYTLQLKLIYVNGFIQATDCIPVQVSTCSVKKVGNWP